jgi:large subunit ribosomal protein L21
MYVIVDIAGQQFKVEKDNQIFVHRLAGAEGDTVEFNKVMLVEDGDSVTVGKPLVDGASVSVKILSHVRGDKVIIFKKKRRKSYQLQKGHRQDFSKVQIENISLNA